MSSANKEHPKKPNPKTGILHQDSVGGPVAPVSQGSGLCFENRKAFSQWLSVQLLVVEEQYHEFETASSLRGYFSR